VAENSTKIHLAVDTFGLPIQFEITGGQVHDCKIAHEFCAALPSSDYKIADKGYNSEDLRQQIRERGEIPVIPRKSKSHIT
jgi:IS5 family transposase